MSVILGADETLERRLGAKIKAKGVFRDAARSSQKYTNYSSGLRWVSMMLLVPLPWSDRVWALPFLTVLAPSPKTNATHGRRHKSSIDWVGQMTTVVRRWLPQRQLVLVVDGAMAAVKLGLRCAGFGNPVTLVSRLRLDAVLHAPPGPQPQGKRGPKPKKGDRLPSLARRLVNPATTWTQAPIDWYGGQQRLIEYVTGTALWYTPGYDPLPIRWVLVRDPLGVGFGFGLVAHSGGGVEQGCGVGTGVDEAGVVWPRHHHQDAHGQLHGADFAGSGNWKRGLRGNLSAGDWFIVWLGGSPRHFTKPGNLEAHSQSAGDFAYCVGF